MVWEEEVEALHCKIACPTRHLVCAQTGKQLRAQRPGMMGDVKPEMFMMECTFGVCAGWGAAWF